MTVRIRMEGTEPHPKWYTYVCYEVPVEQAMDCDGTVYAMPDTDKLDAQIARKQGWGPKDRSKRKSNRGRRVNGQLNKLHRKRARKRNDAAHQANRKLADTTHTVVVEALNTKDMSRSTKGTAEKPGRQVKQRTAAFWQAAGATWHASWRTRPVRWSR